MFAFVLETPNGYALFIFHGANDCEVVIVERPPQKKRRQTVDIAYVSVTEPPLLTMAH